MQLINFQRKIILLILTILTSFWINEINADMMTPWVKCISYNKSCLKSCESWNDMCLKSCCSFYVDYNFTKKIPISITILIVLVIIFVIVKKRKKW